MNPHCDFSSKKNHRYLEMKLGNGFGWELNMK